MNKKLFIFFEKNVPKTPRGGFPGGLKDKIEKEIPGNLYLSFVVSRSKIGLTVKCKCSPRVGIPNISDNW